MYKRVRIYAQTLKNKLFSLNEYLAGHSKVDSVWDHATLYPTIHTIGCLASLTPDH